MTNRNILCIILLTLILTACGGGQLKIEPPKIYYSEDVCDHCNMIISDERFAAAMIIEVSEGRTDSRIFDDIGDMLYYHKKHPEFRVLARYVHDYETHAWLDAETAFYVHSKDVHSPMGHGIIACATQEQALQVADHFNGRVLIYKNLVAMAEAGSFIDLHADSRSENVSGHD